MTSLWLMEVVSGVFFFQAEDGIRDTSVTGVQTCALPISSLTRGRLADARVVGTSAGPVIAAVGSDPTDGTINLYVIEQRGSRGTYAVALRVQIGRASCRERV